MTKEERLERIQEAKELGLKSITIEGVTYELQITYNPNIVTPNLSEDQIKALMNPASPFDELSDDEVLFWSTPHYDEIQKQKELREKQIKEEGINENDRRNS